MENVALINIVQQAHDKVADLTGQGLSNDDLNTCLEFLTMVRDTYLRPGISNAELRKECLEKMTGAQYAGMTGSEKDQQATLIVSGVIDVFARIVEEKDTETVLSLIRA